MPAIRTKHTDESPSRPCRVRDRHGREVLLHRLTSPERRKLEKGDKQYKYHENLERYAGKRIDIRGEYGSSRPPIMPSAETVKISDKPVPLKPCDLDLVRIIGSGSFGSVGVVKVKRREPKHPSDIPGAQMAVKIFRKYELRQDAPSHDAACEKLDAAHDLLNLERRNLAVVDWNPFIAGLYTCLQDSKNLYQLMELGHLGSLKKLIQENGALPTSVCRFYFANLVKITEFLHGMHLIHNDMKPENIVIGADGYLMICDMGISSFREENRNWNSVGTTAYTSPEALQSLVTEELAESVDWWAVACILYEMATGRAVFRFLKGNSDGSGDEQRRSELVQRIIACNWRWPRNLEVDPVLKDIVERMLHPKFEKRLGCIVSTPGEGEGPLTNDEIRAHPFLRRFPWNRLEEKKLAAPFVPTQVPNLREEEWHSSPLPQQKNVPGMNVLDPAPHVRWDKRCGRQGEQWREREVELNEWNKDRLHQSRDERVARIRAKRRSTNSSEKGQDTRGTDHLLRTARARVRGFEATTSSMTRPHQTFSQPVPAVLHPPSSSLRLVSRLRHPAIERILRDGEPIMRGRPRVVQTQALSHTNGSYDIHSETKHRLPARSADFNMSSQTQRPKPLFKEPMLPERVFVGEFGKLAVATTDEASGASDESDDAPIRR